MEEIWDGSVAVIVFDDDGTKHLVCQSGIRMSAETQLRLADDLRRNAIAHYDEIAKIQAIQRKALDERMRNIVKEPKEIEMKKVYLLVAENSYKIGVSKAPDRRLSEILRHQPSAKIVAVSSDLPSSRAFEIEKKLHEHLKSRNIVSEWFSLSKKEADVISKWIKESE